MSSVITFDVTQFRTAFPAFANTTIYPDVLLQEYWDAGICYISNEDSGTLKGDCRRLAINLMTAHLTSLANLIAAGKTPGLVQSSTIDKISVSLTPPPVRTQWQWWLSLTPYGAQLLALLQSRSVGGFSVGGLPEVSAFRKWGGLY